MYIGLCVFHDQKCALEVVDAVGTMQCDVVTTNQCCADMGERIRAGMGDECALSGDCSLAEPVPTLLTKR